MKIHGINPLPPPSIYIRILLSALFLLSLVLRFSLALVNRDANDAHMEVTRIILQTGNLPTWDKCWECFQPKLYHVVLAIFFHISNISDSNEQILFANLVSVTASALALALVCRFLLMQSISPWLSLLAFAFVALNPKFIGISAQATNDSFLILFSTLALISFYEFLLRNKIGFFVLTILSVVIAISTKSSGIITFVVILLVLLLQIILDPAKRARLEPLVLVYLVTIPVLVIINPLNQYMVNNQQFGTPLLLNIERQPLPRFSQPTVFARPGLVSIKDGLLTFKLSDLLAHPRIEDSIDGHFQHRTSLWTQLYARAHSLNFDNWPPSWSTSDESNFPLLRAIYLLALIPTASVIWGVFGQFGQFVLSVWHRDPPSVISLSLGLFSFAPLGYVAFVILYTLLYRDYSVMKAIFLLPALPAYPFAFLTAIENRPGWFYHLLVGVSLPLLCLYVADVTSLILRLA